MTNSLSNVEILNLIMANIYDGGELNAISIKLNGKNLQVLERGQRIGSIPVSEVDSYLCDSDMQLLGEIDDQSNGMYITAAVVKCITSATSRYRTFRKDERYNGHNSYEQVLA
jgi:hypothetical protein